MSFPQYNAREKSGFVGKLLGVVIAITWPVYTLLPDERFGGLLLFNGFLYAALFVLSVFILSIYRLPRRGLVEILTVALIFNVIIYAPATVHSIFSNTPGGIEKSVDIIFSHFIFLIAGVSAGRAFPVVARFFFGTLLVIILVNLAIALYPDFVIVDREKIGLLGGQGFSRIVSLTAIGIIISIKAPGIPGSKTIRTVVFLAAAALILFAGARSSLLGMTIALFTYYLAVNKKLAPFFMLVAIGLGLSIWMVSLFYIDYLRPLLLDLIPESGITRTLLSLDIFYIDEFGTTRIESAMERLVLWQDSIRIALENPLGTGFGGYEQHASVGEEKSPHNILLEIVVEMGLLPGAIYVLFVATLIYLAPRFIMPYFIVLLVLFMFSGDLVDVRQLMFFLGVTLYHLFCMGSIPDNHDRFVQAQLPAPDR